MGADKPKTLESASLGLPRLEQHRLEPVNRRSRRGTQPSKHQIWSRANRGRRQAGALESAGSVVAASRPHRRGRHQGGSVATQPEQHHHGEEQNHRRGAFVGIQAAPRCQNHSTWGGGATAAQVRSAATAEIWTAPRSHGRSTCAAFGRVEGATREGLDSAKSPRRHHP